jgi:ribosomal-protein-alanine N-acetyltransferase
MGAIVTNHRMRIQSDRVCLLPLVAGDTAELASLLSNSIDFHHPWLRYPHTVDGLLHYIDQALTDGDLLFVVRLREADTLVGLMSLSRVVYGAWRTCECGCAVGVEHQGNGYLTEAMGLLVRYAMDVLGLCRVEALVDPRNVASRKMLQSVGFCLEGLARSAVDLGDERLDQVRWAITAADVVNRYPNTGRR